MQPERPLLTIAIPTYNRSSYLTQLLNALVPQLTDELRVELIISDNASPDNTPEVVGRFYARFPNLVYLRNETNIGPDANFLQCFERAKGKYVWIFGDDDVLEPHGLETVLSHLHSDEYDLIYVKSSGFTGGYTPSSRTSSRRISVFNRAQDLACQVHVFFTFISGNILNKDRITSVPHRPFNELIGTNLAQLGWTYTALEHHRRSLIIHDPLVATLSDNTGGYALFKIFGSDLKRITDEWLTSAQVKRTIIRGSLQRFLPFFLLRQKSGSAGFSREDPNEALKPSFGDDPRYWIFDFPIMRLPAEVAKLWFWLVRIVNVADKLIGNPLLRF
jgi:abequosyltransferase